MAWIAVGVGGALGSMGRHGVNHLVRRLWPAMTFPAGTFIVNAVGCLIIGILAGLVASGRLSMRFYWREFVFVGILGGFTTFSSFGLDTMTLARTGAPAAAALNVVGQVGVGLLAVFVGFLVGR